MWQVHSQGSPERKPVKNCRTGAWAYPGLPKVFKYPLLSQERVKIGTSNFVHTFIGLIGTEDYYKFREKYPWAYSQGR